MDMDPLHIRYCEEVLGLAPVVGQVSRTPQVALAVVETEDLGPDTAALLEKVLASVGLVNPPRFSFGAADSLHQHCLRFSGLGGRVEDQGRVIWLLPRLSEMCGGPQAIAMKKEAWALLQRFQRETSA